MKYSVTINLMIEGNIPEVLRILQTHIGEHSSLQSDAEVEVTGINLYKEHEFEQTTAGIGRSRVATEEAQPQSLDEEQENGREESK